MKKKKQPQTVKRSVGRPRKVIVTALIPLDTAKIRKKLLANYKRRKKALEKLESQLQRYNENDAPEFQQFLARRFGAERSRMRELSEKIHLARLRREKLRHMAREEGMSQGNYCAYLESKVTSETDFWTVLENEIREMQEEQRKQDEEFERYCRDLDGEDGDDDEDMDCLDDDFEEDLDDFEEAFDEIFGNGSKSFFKQLFDEDFLEEEEPARDDGRGLKKLYRELCFRYHPDKIGEHDAKTRSQWLSIQAAYDAGDLSRLRAIHAGIELESGKTELICSDIDAMIGDIDCSISMMQFELREKKRAPYWGFSTWSEKQRKETERELAGIYRSDLFMAERELQQCEAELERMRKSCKPKKKKHHAPAENQPDLFSF